MSVDVVARWAGPNDATVSSTYRVERSLDWATWSVLAAAQAATSPYWAARSTLAGDTAYGSPTIDVDDGTDFGSTGYGWLDHEALVQWTGKTGDQLTGVTWHSGYGTYATGSALAQAHESLSDLGVEPTNGAVVYRITHLDAQGNESPPAFLWYYYPPAPASSAHCVVVVNVGADIGAAPQAGLAVQAYLSQDTQFSSGRHLDANKVALVEQTTNALGLAFFSCWKDSRRLALDGGADAAYRFVLDAGTSSKALTVSVPSIPDRDWVLLWDVAEPV